MSGVIIRIFRRFAREERGVVLIIFLLVVIPLLITAAVVIDFSQTLVVKRQLTAAVDSAALSLAQLPDVTGEEAMKDKADAYIRAHYPENAIGSLKADLTSVVRDGERVNVSATAEIPTAFLGIAGKDSWTITINSSVIRRQNKLEVVLVLDNSGSMGSGGKMTAMKAAATDLVNILFGNAETSENVKIGLVPFTAGVNVAVSFADTDWLDKSEPSILNFEIFTNLLENLLNIKTTWGVLQSMRNGITNWGGCLRSRNEPNDIRDTVPDTRDVNTMFSAYFNPFLGDKVSDYKDKTGTAQNTGCPTAHVQGLTNVKSTITSAIDRMTANGNTNIPEGLAWGYRLISPGTPFTAGVPYNDKKTIKNIILLTDGENNVAGSFSSYGKPGLLNLHLGLNPNSTLDRKLEDLCAEIKKNQDDTDDGDDIILYTIAFAVSGPIVNRLDKCATKLTNPPRKTAYTPDNVTELSTTFGEIAASLSELRIAK